MKAILFRISVLCLSVTLISAASKRFAANRQPIAEPAPKSSNIGIVNNNEGESQSGPKPNPKCPNSSPLQNYRYDESARKCGIPGRQEHCAANMIFYAIPTSQTLGQCDCSHRLGDKPTVYYPKTKQCYFTYEQSYCQNGEWLVFNPYGNPVCTKNQCLTNGRPTFGSTSEEFKDLVPFQGNGECVKLYQKYKRCKSDEVVTFVPERLTPQCGKSSSGGIGTKAISPIENLVCAPGSFLSISGKCQPSYVW